MSEPDYNTQREFSNPYLIELASLSNEIRDELHRLWKYGFEVNVPQPGQSLARHAKILTMLSRQADERTKRIINLTRWLCGLTVALLMATGALTWIAWKTDQHIRETHNEHSRGFISSTNLL